MRLLNVSFLNGAPFRALQDLPKFHYSEMPPADCARALSEGSCSAALVPVMSALTDPKDYCFLPYGIIADGAVDTVRLIADCEFEKITRILVDSASRTSVKLLQLIFALRQSQAQAQTTAIVEYVPTPSAEIPSAVTGNTAGLLIGDAVFALGSFRLTLDLADEWKKLTGLPFVFALWAIPSQLLETLPLDEFHQAVINGLKARVELALQEPCNVRLSRAELRHYLYRRINYLLNVRALEGLKQFSQLCRSYNIAACKTVASTPNFRPPDAESAGSPIFLGTK